MPSAKVTSEKKGDVLEVHVSGYIGEDAGLFSQTFLEVKSVNLDLKGVNYINSVGVKNWIMWTSRFPAGLPVKIYNCPSLILNQINMVAGFISKTSTVESILAPFVCEDCNRESTELLMRGKDYEYASEKSQYFYKAPLVPCGKCRKPMELDSIESKFFTFLKSAVKG